MNRPATRAFQWKPGSKINLQELCIESERLRLIPIEDRFAETIFAEFTAEITRYMFPTPAATIDETRQFIAVCTKSLAEESEIVLAATDKATGEFLGCVGLHGRTSAKKPDLGLWFKKSAHGKGLGKEAIYAVKDWADAHLLLEAYRYPVDRANRASRRIPESLGGVIVEELIAATMDPDKFLDEIVFEIPAGS